METTTHTAWITIGHETTQHTAWTHHADGSRFNFTASFNADVREVVERCGASIVTEHETLGEWQGQPEHGQAFLITWTDETWITEFKIRGGLSHLAWKYGQEAIGFVGNLDGPTLVRPS